MIYQQPLAYLLGLEGVALLRAWAGEYDQEFTEARLAEIRALLDNAALVDHPCVLVSERDSVPGYRDQAAVYDAERNGLFDIDEPVVGEIVDALATGDALDAACGTGRFAEQLAARGHRVVGVDSSPEMLERARTRVPRARFELGELQRLPLGDDSVDLVVCALALVHVPELAAVFAEFARVLRPGGQLVISDVHHMLVLLGSAIGGLDENGAPGRVVAVRRTAGDFLRAALPVGFQVRRCDEPRWVRTDPLPPAETDADPGHWQDWPWSLMQMAPAAVDALGGIRGLPQLIIWHFELA